MKIKHLPEEERPMERAWMRGTETLNDTELLALIIRNGSAERSAVELAGDLIAGCGGGIRAIAGAKPQELTGLKGIGKAKACAIAAAFELGRRAVAKPLKGKFKIGCASDVADLFMEDLRGAKKEHFRCLLLDTKGCVISIEEIAVGTLSGAQIHPREALSGAVRKSAASVAFAHNHPSGDPTPSDADIHMTARLVQAAEILGIRVLDHVIIGDGDYVSLKATGLMD